jgi:hypothetical protein
MENELGSLEYSDLLRQVMNQSSEQSADIMVHETSSSDEETSPQAQVKIEQIDNVIDTKESDYQSLPKQV